MRQSNYRLGKNCAKADVWWIKTAPSVLSSVGTSVSHNRSKELVHSQFVEEESQALRSTVLVTLSLLLILREIKPKHIHFERPQGDHTIPAFLELSKISL
jgi:hypothetical protein